MRIRTMKPADVSAAAKIVGENYSKQYQRKSHRELDAMFRPGVVRPRYIVAEEHGTIIGLTGYSESWMDYNVYHIFWVNVAPKWQGKEVGRKLVQRTIELIKQHKKGALILITTTRPAFYQRFGFKILIKKLRKNYNLMALRLK